jgi:hypothetical protein
LDANEKLDRSDKLISDDDLDAFLGGPLHCRWLLVFFTLSAPRTAHMTCCFYLLIQKLATLPIIGPLSCVLRYRHQWLRDAPMLLSRADEVIEKGLLAAIAHSRLAADGLPLAGKKGHATDIAPKTEFDPNRA